MPDSSPPPERVEGQEAIDELIAVGWQVIEELERNGSVTSATYNDLHRVIAKHRANPQQEEGA